MFTTDLFNQNDNWLKIASIAYDIIHCSNRRMMTPKHYLLGNEIFRHERSSQLLTITNRLGYTCSYVSMCRLQQQAAEEAKSSGKDFGEIQRNLRTNHHEFAIKVADNFDLNKDTLHGENSLHMLNQIIVTTPE